jgi:dTDP-4-amino-4,6-dideoxygalactose transaminase
MSSSTISPVRFLDLKAQYDSLRPDIDVALARVIAQASFVGGDDVRKFEHEFAAYQDVAHCVCVANGTDAIEILLEALELPAGSEVIVPANTFIGTAEPVTRAGLRVVFADVNPDTYLLDPADVERRISSRTKAIIAVHLYGQPADLDALQVIANRHQLILLEDAAQAHGAEISGRRVGGLARAATFSFYPGKNLGAYGDGGAITTNDGKLAQRCRMIANHGRTEKYLHQQVGRNSRLDGIQAAVLRVKLPHLEDWLARRAAIAAIYEAELADVGDLVRPTVAAGRRHVWHLYVIRTAYRDALASFLKARGIETGIHYPVALSRQPAYADHGQADEPTFANRSDVMLLSLPMGEHLTEADVNSVTVAVRDFFSSSAQGT